jgi:hypothetical protein
MTKANTKQVEEQPVIEPILVKNMQLMQYAHQTHVCITRSTLTKSQIQDEATWAFVAKKLRMHDRVQVMDSQASQLAEGIVTYVSGNKVKVQIYALHKLNDSDMTEIPYKDYLIRWGGVASKWTIVAKSDGTILREDFPSDDEAIAYLKDHYKALLS